MMDNKEEEQPNSDVMNKFMIKCAFSEAKELNWKVLPVLWESPVLCQTGRRMAEQKIFFVHKGGQQKQFVQKGGRPNDGWTARI